MVELIVGPKGRGKTKFLLDYAAQEIGTASGTIAFLDKNKGHMYELSNKIRLIDVMQFGVKTNQEFIGFILGLLSQDHDLEQVYIDAFTLLAHIENQDITDTVLRLDEVGRDFGVKFILSVGIDEKDVPDVLKAYIKASL